VLQYPQNGGSSCGSLVVTEACTVSGVTCSACDNGSKDSSESDVDCGGSSPCSRCGDGRKCGSISDCSSGLTCTNGRVCVGTPPHPSFCWFDSSGFSFCLPFSAASLVFPSPGATVNYVQSACFLPNVTRADFFSTDAGNKLKAAIALHVNAQQASALGGNTLTSSDVKLLGFSESSARLLRMRWLATSTSLTVEYAVVVPPAISDPRIIVQALS
jgi:hypothetical protein